MTPTGLDPIELAILRTLREGGRTTDGPYLRCARLISEIAEREGFAPVDSYLRTTVLAHDWVTRLRLIDFHGNCGARSFEAAEPRYTEVRLTALGAVCADADSGHGPPIPAGLINGDVHKGGTRPPLPSSRLIQVLRELAAGQQVDPVTALGAVSFPSGCHVEGDVGRLYAGDVLRLTLRAQITVEDDRIVISGLPLDVGENEVAHLIASRGPRPELDTIPDAALRARLKERDLPIRDVNDETTSRTGTRLVVRPALGADLPELADQIAQIWGIQILLDCTFAKPIIEVLGEWLDQPNAVDGLEVLERLM